MMVKQEINAKLRKMIININDGQTGNEDDT